MNVNLKTIESELHRAMTAESPDRSAMVEALISALLSGAFGLSARSTDGFVPLREEIGSARYFAVGKIFMIDGQSAQPVALDLVFADEIGIKAGSVRLGARLAVGRAVSESRFERSLFAYPHEMADTLTWTHIFERHLDGWLLLNTNAEPDEPLQDVEVVENDSGATHGNS